MAGACITNTRDFSDWVLHAACCRYLATGVLIRISVVRCHPGLRGINPNYRGQ